MNHPLATPGLPNPPLHFILLFFLNKGDVVGCQQPYLYYSVFSLCQDERPLLWWKDAGACFIRRVWPDEEEEGPLLSLSFLPRLIPPHIGVLLRPSRGGGFSAAGCPSPQRSLQVIVGGILPLFLPPAAFGASTVHCQGSRLLVSPLNPCGGRLRLHVHDTWTYRGVFNHSSSRGTVYIPAPI